MVDYKIPEIKKALEQANNVLVVTHISPDGDALGSLISWGIFLQQLGKRMGLVCDDGIFSRFDFLALNRLVEKTIRATDDYDLVIVVDCGDVGRMGRAYPSLPKSRPVLINIDHHITNTYFGDINVIDLEANSTAEILYELFKGLGATFSPALATSLLTGVVTDTLGFRTVGVTPRTLHTAAELLACGGDLPTIVMQTLTLKPFSALRLWQRGMNNMRCEDGLLWTAISDGERREIGYLNTSSSGLVNMLADVDEVAIGMVMLEYNDKVYVGFRCRPPFNVAGLAVELGGGGHPLASGCTLDGPLDKIQNQVVELAKDTIRQQQVAGRK